MELLAWQQHCPVTVACGSSGRWVGSGRPAGQPGLCGNTWLQRRSLCAAGGAGVIGGVSPVCLFHPQVTLIPTFDSAVMHRWYEETHEQHQALGIRVLGSGSMVSMQDEAFPACKVEF